MASPARLFRLALPATLLLVAAALLGTAGLPGWSPDQLWYGLGGIAAALLVASGLVLGLRRQVARHTADLREQLRRETELEAEHRDLIENANDIIFTLDRHNRVIAFNAAGERLTGFARHEVIGRTLTELCDPNTDPSTLDQTANRTRTFELAIRTKNGWTAVWEVSARPAKRNGVLAVTKCIARDVTDRKRAHEELRRLYLIRDQQIEHSPLAFIEWDGQLRVVRWSRRAEHIFGWRAEEALGLTFDELGLVFKEDEGIVRATTADVLGGHEFVTAAIRNYTKDRSVLHVEWYHSALRDSAGRVTCVISLAQDVTARKKAEDEQRRLEDQVRQSQKMEAVGRLAGGIAHDFNNLLTVINGCATLLLDESVPGEPANELADEIRRAGEQAASLTRQLLAFGRRQITAPTALDLNDSVREVEKMLRRLIGEHIELMTELDPAGARVKADPGLMVQLLMNLAVNARDAMPDGGRLTLRTQSLGGRVRLVVADTGVGMDAQTQAHIFEPFFTTKKAGEGTGIGLATVHGIVEQSGGTISVDSAVGRGTTFRIELPACPDAPPAGDAASVHGSVVTSRETVLLVEDEDLVRKLAQRVLEARGYRVFAAEGGEDALELHGRIDGRVDLVVTDVVMPGLGGRQLAERLRERQPDLRVLYMSGYTSDDVLRQGIQSEEMHFIQKPFTPEGLARKVRDILHYPNGTPVPVSRV